MMLTPYSVCAKKAGEGRSTCEANFQAATSMGKQFQPWNGSNELGMGGGRGEAGVGGRNRRPAVGDGQSGGDGGSAR